MSDSSASSSVVETNINEANKFNTPQKRRKNKGENKKGHNAGRKRTQIAGQPRLEFQSTVSVSISFEIYYIITILLF